MPRATVSVSSLPLEADLRSNEIVQAAEAEAARVAAEAEAARLAGEEAAAAAKAQQEEEEDGAPTLSTPLALLISPASGRPGGG